MLGSHRKIGSLQISKKEEVVSPNPDNWSRKWGVGGGMTYSKLCSCLFLFPYILNIKYYRKRDAIFNSN